MENPQIAYVSLHWRKCINIALTFFKHTLFSFVFIISVWDTLMMQTVYTVNLWKLLVIGFGIEIKHPIRYFLWKIKSKNEKNLGENILKNSYL